MLSNAFTRAIKSEGGTCTCETYYKCKNCDQTVNKKLHKKVHVCHEVYCKTCKDFFTEDHQCYMQPVETDTTSNKKTAKKRGHFQYIFFDFECTQDDVLQCEQGYIAGQDSIKCKNCGRSWCGTYKHRPNLCAVHKVCEMCIDKPVTSESCCEACGKNKLVFQRARTADDFCKMAFYGRKHWGHSDLP